MQTNKESISVISAPLPFSNLQTQAKAMPGTSLEEIVANVMPERYKDAGLGIAVMINGEIIPQEHWKSIRPKANTLVNVRIVPQGGGGKNPLAAILSIVVLIAAPYIAPAILGAGLAGTAIGIGTLTYGGVLTAAIGVIGRLAISALVAPPKQSNSGYGNIDNPAQSPTQFIEGAQNSLNPYGVVPINLGTNRIFPFLAARTFTESENNDQYVRQLFTYGYADNMVIEDRKIGETSLDDFVDFDIEDKLNGDLHEGTNLYTQDVSQENLSIVLEQVDGYSTRTTAANSDEAIVDITFPQGLAEFDKQGKRNSRRVQLEMQYSKTGENNWSPAATAFTTQSAKSLDVAPVPGNYWYVPGRLYTRTDTLVIDKYSGVITILSGSNSSSAIPSNSIRLAEISVETIRAINSNGPVTTTLTVQDARPSSAFGTTFQNTNSFVTTTNGTDQVSVSSGGIAVDDLNFFENTSEALRASQRVVFPERAQYDIRIKRITADSESDQILDVSAWTALKSIRYETPVNLEGQCGSAIRMKGSDQLNGAIEQYNVLASSVIPSYNPDLDIWEDAISSNPAALYRYIYQCPANAKALPDSKLNLEEIQDWYVHCIEQNYTYNRNIDYETTVADVARDICAAGNASPAIVDGKRTIVIDRVKDDITTVITPRNSWGYKGEMIYAEIPHALRVQFRNEDKGFIQDELIVYNDGYDENNATEFELLELLACTNAELAFKKGRRTFAEIKLRPETHTFMQDIENLVLLRGNRIKFAHDAPIIGVGDGRIKAVITSGDDPNTVTGFTLDDIVSIPNNGMYYVRIQLSDGGQIYEEITTFSGQSDKTFNFKVPLDIADTPAIGDNCYVVEAGGELDLIITSIQPQGDDKARITGINYAPEIFEAENAPIPQFVSNITEPLEFQRPLAPLLLESQSDESVMLLNSDGTFLTRAIFTLENRNEGEVDTKVKIRVSGTSNFTNANILESSPDRLIITGLEDGKYYDIHIRYRRAGANALSKPLELNQFFYVGTSSDPQDVTGFKINVVDNVSFFKWDKNDDIDISHYSIKYSNIYSGASWDTAQILEQTIYETKFTAPFLGGTYLIKGMDLSGNESVNATAIITYDPGTVANAIAVIDEHPSFSGVLEDVEIINNAIVLEDAAITTGYYYFDESLDLGGIFPSFVSAKILAGGVYINDVSDPNTNNIFDYDDIFAVEDIFGIGFEGWAVDLQYRITQTDPTASPVWSDWESLEAGTITFWGIEFRVALISTQNNISPSISTLTINIDMPDRIERGEDLTVPTGGATVTFSPAFKVVPTIVATIQDGDGDDIEEITNKTAGGFTIKVYNKSTAGYVARSIDYIASGYGRENT